MRLLLVTTAFVFGVNGAFINTALADNTKASVCAASLAAVFVSACRMGTSVQNTQCRGAIQNLESECDALKSCRYSCRKDKRAAKAEIKQIFRSCKAACSKQGNKKSCKTICKQSKKKAMKALRTSRKNCKKTCRDDYKDTHCRRARAKFVAWATALGGSIAVSARACRPKGVMEIGIGPKKRPL